MEKSLKDCGYHVFTKKAGEEKLIFSDTGPALITAEISCSNCQLIAETQALGNTNEQARSNALVKASLERKKYCPIINKNSPLKFTPGEKKVPEYFSPTVKQKEASIPRGWIVLT